MRGKVLILGGYGNFGSRIALALVKKRIPIIIAGRNKLKASQLCDELNVKYPESHTEFAIFDIHAGFDEQLKKIQPDIVINTCGPFQNSDYSIAESCIQHKIHYIDLADARDFVVGISSLNEKAKKNDVLIVSGASTVPGLSSAVLEHYKKNFSEIDSLIYGISPGQQAPRGLATTQSILTYLGKPLKLAPGNSQEQYGWQDLYRQYYPVLGKRWMANGDIPDLDLFSKRYGIKSMRFSAGMENVLLHFSMWAVSWLVRLGLPINLTKHAAKLLQISTLFDGFGSADGGMHMLMKGKSYQGESIEIQWFVIAKDGDGPQIPCVPAIVLAQKLIAGQIQTRGAVPCVAMVNLEEYMKELKEYSIKEFVKQI